MNSKCSLCIIKFVIIVIHCHLSHHLPSLLANGFLLFVNCYSAESKTVFFVIVALPTCALFISITCLFLFKDMRVLASLELSTLTLKGTVGIFQLIFFCEVTLLYKFYQQISDTHTILITWVASTVRVDLSANTSSP